MKQCVLVVGMHRSGTSLMAGALKIMGVDFGEKFLGYDTGNVKGHFEHTDILDANNAILSAFNSKWDDPNPLPERWYEDSRISPYREKIRQVIARDFMDSDLFGIKEPRVSILLPVYLDILHERSITPLFVVMERPFEEIAESLYKRDKLPVEQSLRLCQKYWNAVSEFTKEKKTVNVKFDELLQAPRGTLEKIGQTLGINLKDFGSAEKELLYFIDPRLKHFEAGKVTPMTVKNRITKTIDTILPFHTRRRKFIKHLIYGRKSERT